jgi:hypothetical protein
LAKTKNFSYFGNRHGVTFGDHVFDLVPEEQGTTEHAEYTEA